MRVLQAVTTSHAPRRGALICLIAAGVLVAVTGCGQPATTGSATTALPTALPTAMPTDIPTAIPTAPQTTQASASAPSTPGTRDLQRGPAHPDRTTIIDGSWLIGSDYPPALYLLPTAVSRCHWRVVDYATGSLIEDGRYAGPGPAAIWVGDGDLFQSEGCLLWQGYAQLTGSREASAMPVPSDAFTIGDGRWVIGQTAPAGRYRSDRRSIGACSYQVDRAGERDDESFESTGTVRSIPSYLDLAMADGEVLSTQGCGAWQLLD